MASQPFPGYVNRETFMKRTFIAALLLSAATTTGAIAQGSTK